MMHGRAVFPQRLAGVDMISVGINAPNTRFYISSFQQMPLITLQAMPNGITIQDRPTFLWTFALDYPDFIAIPGGLRRNARAKSHPRMPSRTGQVVTVPLTTVMCGRLTATVECTVGRQKTAATRSDILIGGTNPSPTELSAVVQQPLLRRMIRQESGGKQFSDTAARLWTLNAINPNWSGDNARGVGLGQLTNPEPADGDIWNWRINAQHLIERFQGKRAAGTTLHSRIAASPQFQAEAQAFAAWRVAEGLPPLTVRLAPLDANQLDLEGLRAYNGFGIAGAGKYLNYVHEFEPGMTVLRSSKRKGPGGPLQASLLDVDGNGYVRWAQVSGAERLRRYNGLRSGDPDYVANVLRQPAG